MTLLSSQSLVHAWPAQPGLTAERRVRGLANPHASSWEPFLPAPSLWAHIAIKRVVSNSKATLKVTPLPLAQVINLAKVLISTTLFCVRI